MASGITAFSGVVRIRISCCVRRCCSALSASNALGKPSSRFMRSCMLSGDAVRLL